MKKTIVEKKQEMAIIKSSIEEKIKAYNEALLDNKPFDVVSKIDTDIKDGIKEYTTLARDVCFDEIAMAENPMVEAAKRLNFETIAVKDEKKTEDKIFVRVLTVKDKKINLLELNKYISGGIGNDKSWNLMIEKFNLMLTIKRAIDLGIKDITTINDSFFISRAAKDIEMGKNPVSNTNMLKTLTKVIQAMMGEEYKPLTHDVNFLNSVYSKKSKKDLTITCANTRHFVNYILEVCHRIVTNGHYDVEYKKAKK